MDFLVISAVIFACGTVFVCADYYIEFRMASAGASSSSGHPEMATYLYECRGEPEGKFAFVAKQSLCTLVTTYDQKLDIYVNCNFFNVHNPNPRGHVIQLEDRGVMSLQTWYLGFRKGAIDHPNFAVPDEDAIDHFENELNEIWPSTGCGTYLISNLSFFFAQNNLVSYSRNFGVTNGLFNGFVTYLRKLTERYSSMKKENEDIKFLYTEALKIGLRKMIDPCSILHAEYRQFTGNYCAVYCNFLNIVALHFDATSSLGPPLKGGHCASVVCMCKREVKNPLAGCNTSPMQQLHNEMRFGLNM